MTPRFQRHPFLALFDGPDTNTSTEARRASIVPQQALYSLNNPFVDELARLLARRIISTKNDESGRLRYALESTWSRAPTAAEANQYSAWLRKARELANDAVSSEGCEEESWTSLTRVLLAANEFLYVD